MSIAKISRLNVSFADGEVLTATKLNTVISGINTAVDKMNECIDTINESPSVETVEFFNENYDEYYAGTVAELYLSVADVVRGYSVKYYNSSLFVKGMGSSTSDVTWTVRIYDTTTPLENGVIYPLQVTTAGSDSQVAVGDIVGYIIFKDISKFRNQNTSGNPVTVVTETVQNINNSPTIKNYINNNNA